MTLHLAPKPCNTCPYRRSTPSGIWHPENYEKLPEFDPQEGGPGRLATFLCHQTQATGIETVCRGWLHVHADGPAVRYAIARGALTIEQRRDAAEDAGEPCYGSGREAFIAGMRDIAKPGDAARSAQEKLLRIDSITIQEEP